MSNCSNHKKEVAGISDMKELATLIGDLHYQTLAEFLKLLKDKLYEDSRSDFAKGRGNLSLALLDASIDVGCASRHISGAWQISKPFMEPENKKS